MEISAEIIKEISVIADDENAMRKLLRYLKKLTKNVHERKMAEDITENIANGLRLVKMEKEGKIKLNSLENLINELGD